MAVGDEAITVERDQPAEGEPGAVEIPFDAIGEARLILTDDLTGLLRVSGTTRSAAGDTWAKLRPRAAKYSGIPPCQPPISAPPEKESPSSFPIFRNPQ